MKLIGHIRRAAVDVAAVEVEGHRVQGGFPLRGVGHVFSGHGGRYRRAPAGEDAVVFFGIDWRGKRIAGAKHNGRNDRAAVDVAAVEIKGRGVELIPDCRDGQVLAGHRFGQGGIPAAEDKAVLRRIRGRRDRRAGSLRDRRDRAAAVRVKGDGGVDPLRRDGQVLGGHRFGQGGRPAVEDEAFLRRVRGRRDRRACNLRDRRDRAAAVGIKSDGGGHPLRRDGQVGAGNRFWDRRIPAGKEIALLRRIRGRRDGRAVNTRDRIDFAAAVGVKGDDVAVDQPVRLDRIAFGGHGRGEICDVAVLCPVKEIVAFLGRIGGRGDRRAVIRRDRRDRGAAVGIEGDRELIEDPVCGVVALTGAAGGDRDGHVVFARQTRAAPAGEAVAGAHGRGQRDVVVLNGVVGGVCAGEAALVERVIDVINGRRPDGIDRVVVADGHVVGGLRLRGSRVGIHVPALQQITGALRANGNDADAVLIGAHGGVAVLIVGQLAAVAVDRVISLKRVKRTVQAVRQRQDGGSVRIHAGQPLARLVEGALEGGPFVVGVACVEIAAGHAVAADAGDAERGHLGNGAVDGGAQRGLVDVGCLQADIAAGVGVVVAAGGLFGVAIQTLDIIHLLDVAGVQQRPVPGAGIADAFVGVIASGVPVVALAGEDIVALHGRGLQTILVRFVPGASVAEGGLGNIRDPPAARAVVAGLIRSDGQADRQIRDLIQVAVAAGIDRDRADGFCHRLGDDILVVAAVFRKRCVSDAPVLVGITAAIIIAGRFAVVFEKHVGIALRRAAGVGEDHIAAVARLAGIVPRPAACRNALRGDVDGRAADIGRGGAAGEAGEFREFQIVVGFIAVQGIRIGIIRHPVHGYAVHAGKPGQRAGPVGAAARARAGQCRRRDGDHIRLVDVGVGIGLFGDAFFREGQRPAQIAAVRARCKGGRGAAGDIHRAAAGNAAAAQRDRTAAHRGERGIQELIGERRAAAAGKRIIDLAGRFGGVRRGGAALAVVHIELERRAGRNAPGPRVRREINGLRHDKGQIAGGDGRQLRRADGKRRKGAESGREHAEHQRGREQEREQFFHSVFLLLIVKHGRIADG